MVHLRSEPDLGPVTPTFAPSTPVKCSGDMTPRSPKSPIAPKSPGKPGDKTPKKNGSKSGENDGGGKDGKECRAHLKTLQGDPGIDWSSIGGLDEHVSKVRESVILPLLQPEVFAAVGLSRAKGILFYGAPGTGKTLMARGLVGECRKFGIEVTFYARKSADLLSKYIGEGEKHLRELFETARKTEPSVIFFDEIDGLAPVRNTSSDHSHSSIVSTLLALMDGLEDRGQVIVIGATNRPDSVDPALRRPGRFDFELEFKVPDVHQRASIFRVTSKDMPEDFYARMAHRTPGFTGADIRAVCTEATLNSVRRAYPQLYQKGGEASKLFFMTPGKQTKVSATEEDYEVALVKCRSSSDRSCVNPAQPLRQEVKPLFDDNVNTVIQVLQSMCPDLLTVRKQDESASSSMMLHRKSSTAWKHPHVVITGEGDFVSKFVAPAVLHRLEHLPIFPVDIVSLVSKGIATTAQNFAASAFREAERRAPSVIYLANMDRWLQFAEDSLKLTLLQCLTSLGTNSPVSVICTVNGSVDRLEDFLTGEMEDLMDHFETVELQPAAPPARTKFLLQLFSMRIEGVVDLRLRKFHRASREQKQQAEQMALADAAEKVAKEVARKKAMEIPELCDVEPGILETEPARELMKDLRDKMIRVAYVIKSAKKYEKFKGIVERIWEATKANHYTTLEQFEAEFHLISSHKTEDRAVAKLLWADVSKKVAGVRESILGEESSAEQKRLFTEVELAHIRRSVTEGIEWIVWPLICQACIFASESEKVREAPEFAVNAHRLRQLWPDFMNTARILGDVFRNPEAGVGKSRSANKALQVVLEKLGKQRLTHVKISKAVESGRFSHNDRELMKALVRMSDKAQSRVNKAILDIKGQFGMLPTAEDSVVIETTEETKEESRFDMTDVSLPWIVRNELRQCVSELYEEAYDGEENGDDLGPTFVKGLRWSEC